MSNIKNFIQGYTNKVKNRFDLLDTHIQEQAMWRAFLCNECLDNGKCLICKCSTPAMFYAPAKKDSQGHWGAMLDKQQWEEFKSTNQEYKDFINGTNTESTREIQPGVELLDGESSTETSVQETVSRGQQPSEEEKLKDNVVPDASVSPTKPVLRTNAGRPKRRSRKKLPAKKQQKKQV